MTVLDTRVRTPHSPLSVLPLLGGLWLLAAPFVLGCAAYHPHARAMIVDLAVGATVAWLASVQVLHRDERWAGRLTVVLGLFLMAAPALFSYGPDRHLRGALENDLATGAFITLTTLVALLVAALRRD